MDAVILIVVLVAAFVIILVIAAKLTSRSRAAAAEVAREQEHRAEQARQALAQEIVESPDKQFSALAIPQLDALRDIRDTLDRTNQLLADIRFRAGWILFILLVPGLIGLIVVVASLGSLGE